MPIARIGPEFLVNSTTENYQVAPVVVQLADGRIAAAPDIHAINLGLRVSW